MEKNRYEAPATYTLKVELHHLMDNSPQTLDGTVYKNGSGNTQANDQSHFNSEDGPGNGETSDAKKGGYNPWTAWDNLPAWE